MKNGNVLNLFSISIITIILSNNIANATQYAVMPSFLCEKNNTELEKTICDSVELSDLDSGLATRYFYLKRNTNNAPILLKNQREWLKSRKQCNNDESCLKDLYKKRIDSINRALDSGNLSPVLNPDSQGSTAGNADTPGSSENDSANPTNAVNNQNTASSDPSATEQSNTLTESPAEQQSASKPSQDGAGQMESSAPVDTTSEPLMPTWLKVVFGLFFLSLIGNIINYHQKQKIIKVFLRKQVCTIDDIQNETGMKAGVIKRNVRQLVKRKKVIDMGTQNKMYRWFDDTIDYPEGLISKEIEIDL